MVHCEKALVSGSVMKTEQMFLDSGVCNNLVLKLVQIINVLTVINEKLTFV